MTQELNSSAAHLTITKTLLLFVTDPCQKAKKNTGGGRNISDIGHSLLLGCCIESHRVTGRNRVTKSSHRAELSHKIESQARIESQNRVTDRNRVTKLESMNAQTAEEANK